MIEVMAAATCQLAGVNPINPNQKCLGVDPKTNSIGFVPSTSSGGAIGLMGNLIALTYTPPLRTGDYFSYLAQNFGIAKPAYAAGTGFEGLSPLMGLWIAFRNIVYLLFVLVFVVIGVAIMLRVKIDPRTVMTIENQIPKIIIGLLLVTFSFAIAGFLIDLMWVSIYLIFGVISSAPEIGKSVTNLNPSTMQGQNAFEAVGGLGGIAGLTNTAALSITEIIRSFLGISAPDLNNLFNPFEPFTNLLFDPSRNTVANIIIYLLSWAAGATMYFNVAHIPSFTTPILGDIINAIKTGPGAIAAAVGTYSGTQLLLRFLLPYLIAYLIIFIALLFALARLWFELIKAYIFILLDVVLAPFFIVFGLLPGSPIGFGAWMRDILANLSAFPVTIGMLLLGRVFMENFGQTQTAGQFVPPLIGNPSAIDTIKSLIGLGIILMTPQVVEMMKAVFKAPKLDTSAIGGAIGAGTGIPGGAIGTAAGLMTASKYDITGEAGKPSGRIGRMLQRLIR